MDSNHVPMYILKLKHGAYHYIFISLVVTKLVFVVGRLLKNN